MKFSIRIGGDVSANTGAKKTGSGVAPRWAEYYAHCAKKSLVCYTLAISDNKLMQEFISEVIEGDGEGALGIKLYKKTC